MLIRVVEQIDPVEFAASVADDGRGTAIVSGHGELDAYAAESFHEVLSRIALDASFGRVILDFSKVTFLDSTGLRTLLSAAKVASDRGASLTLVSDDVRVVKVLRLTGTATLLDLRRVLADAMSSTDGGLK